MRVLVTGAAGLVGQAVTSGLVKSGLNAIPLYRNPAIGTPLSGALFADLARQDVSAKLSSSEFEAIVHCAALFPGPTVQMTQDEISDHNRTIDGAILDIARERQCFVVYMSSVGVYGNSSLPWRESSTPYPLSPYAKSKLESEAVFLEHATRCVCLRISSPYGSGQKSLNVLRLFLERAMSNQDIRYHGSGRRAQDFVAASDIAAATLSVIANPQARGVFNIASGSPISMRDLGLLVVNCVAGCRSKVLASGHTDPQEGYRAEVDIEKARKKLGWRPSVTLEDGIRSWAKDLGTLAC